MADEKNKEVGFIEEDLNLIEVDTIESKVSAGTIARTIVLALALMNQMLALFGKGTIDITEDIIYQACTAAATIGSAIWAWWKNNSITKAARAGDDEKEAVKAQALLAGAYTDNCMDPEDEA